jgi:hypothetical protein
LSFGRLVSVPLLRWIPLQHGLYGLIFFSIIGSVLMFALPDLSLLLLLPSGLALGVLRSSSCCLPTPAALCL